MTAPTKLDAGKARGQGEAPRVFRRGAHFPFAVRWFGVTMLFGHARSMIASAIASEQIDSRDWMRPQEADELLRAILETLGGDASAATLTEGLGRPVWIDFVADTGDDRDVSAAVGKMLFREYEIAGRLLPRGDILLFGGDTAYPVATVEEINARVIGPWTETLADLPLVPRRVLLGVPGNHDWYDGLDGFARLFRVDAQAAQVRESQLPPEPPPRPVLGRKAGFLVRHLHLDEWGAFFGGIKDFAVAVSALWRRRTVSRRKRLALPGYESVQEATYFCFPLAKGLDVFGVDRQLSRLDFRQRSFFRRRRALDEDTRVLFVAPDPALAFDEPWELGQAMLRACKLDLEEHDVLYMTGDMHHYERRHARGGRSMHVIAGGGGAFLHGTRIRPGPGGPPDAVYPDGKTCRRLVGQVPSRLMLGGSGFLIHFGFAAIAAVELAASLRGFVAFTVSAACVSVFLALTFHLTARASSAHPRWVAALAVPFGVVLGALPVLLRVLLVRLVHLGGGQLRSLGVASVLASDGAVMVVYAFLGALGFGLFLATLALAGLEHQQAYAALSHPGFKHFVRLCVHPEGRVEAWTIGKDDPLANEEPELVDRFAWDSTNAGG